MAETKQIRIPVETLAAFRTAAREVLARHSAAPHNPLARMPSEGEIVIALARRALILGAASPDLVPEEWRGAGGGR